MRFYQIALFLFIFNLMAGMTIQLGLFGGTGFHPIEEGLQQRDDVEAAYEDVNTADEQNGILGDLNFLVENVRLVISAVGIFIDVFANSVLVGPVLRNILCSFQNCGEVLNDFIGIIEVGVLMTYVVGLVQLLAGRPFRNMR